MFLAGCATISTQTYDQVREARDTSGPQGAVKVLEQAGGTDLLSQLEYGEMLRLASRHEDSLKAFQSADQKVGEWENGARSDIEKTAGMVLGAVVSERLTAYEGGVKSEVQRFWQQARAARRVWPARFRYRPREEFESRGSCEAGH